MANLDVGYAADGTPKTYATIAAAYAAAAASGDTIRLFYSGPALENMFAAAKLGGDWIDKQVGIQGQLAVRSNIVPLTSGTTAWLSPNLTTTACNFSNLRILGGGLFYRGYVDVGGVVAFWNCEFLGCYAGIYEFAQTTYGGATRIRSYNCLFQGCYYGRWMANTTGEEVQFCTFINCYKGIYGSSGSFPIVTSCLFVDNGIHVDACSETGAGLDNNYSTKRADGTSETIPGTANDCDNLRSAVGLWSEESGQYVTDTRILDTGDAYAKGLTIAGITTDAFGNDRGGPPSPGWHEGEAIPSTTCTYADAGDVRLGVDRGDGTPGTCRVPPVGKVQLAYAYDAADSLTGTLAHVAASNVRLGVAIGDGNTGDARIPAAAQVEAGVVFDTLDSLTGSYVTPAVASAAPTALTIADAGDGLTWLVTATGQAAGAAIALYNHAGDALVAVVDGSARTRDLTAGQSLYAKALESGKTLSARFPAAAGVAVSALVANVAPTAAQLEKDVTVRVNGVAVTGTLECGTCTPLVPATGEQLYRVVEIHHVPGGTYKELVVEKLARPTWLDNR